MTHQIIEIPKEIKFLSEIMTDLPHNTYIHKGVTGCGGTTLVLTNDQPYVVAVHSKSIVDNKTEQHPNILGVTGDTTDSEIIQYMMKSTVQKYIVTYDSLPRLLTFIKAEKFRLLVDEVQVLIRYVGHFKPAVCIKLIERAFNFKSTSFLTATPTLHEYLPEPIRQLQYIEYKWLGAVKPSIMHTYVGSQLITKLVSFIVDKLDTTDKELYVFFNSRAGVGSAIKKLISLKPELTINDFNVIFADNRENLDYFRKHIDPKFKIGKVSLVKNSRINFISSFGFEGVDFYSENPLSIIVSDPRSKSMRYDISIDLPQIVGRFRRNKTTLLLPDNEIYFIWNTMSDQSSLTQDEYIAKFNKARSEAELLFSQAANGNDTSKRNIQLMCDIDKSPFVALENAAASRDDRVYMYNPYALESEMSSYAAVNQDFVHLANIDNSENIKNESIIISKVANLTNTLSTFKIPELSLEYTKRLGRTVSFVKLCKELEEIETDIIENENILEIYEELKEKRENMLLLHPNLKEYLDYGISLSNMKMHGYNQKKIKEVYEHNKFIDDNLKVIKNLISLKVDDVYTVESILDITNTMIKQIDVEKNMSLKDIKKMFDIKQTTKYLNGKVVNAYRVVSLNV